MLVGENLATETDARRIAGRLTDAIAKPFDIGDDVAFVDASIGIALSGGNDIDPDQLLRNANTA